MRVQGGTTGLLAAIDAGYIDARTGRDWRDPRFKFGRTVDWRRLHHGYKPTLSAPTPA